MTKRLCIGQDLFDLIYPVGSYYETSNTSWTPQDAGWYGTWVNDTGGRVTVSVDGSSDFPSIGTTGGSKYLQEHRHNQSLRDSGSRSGVASYEWYLTNNGRWYTGTDLAGSVCGVSTGNSGNLQPYIVVRRWHRTA